MDIIKRWEDGNGNWLDIAKPISNMSSDGNLLDFGSMKLGDAVLNKAYDKIKAKNATEVDYITCVALLDSIYHTQLVDPIRMGKKIFSNRSILEGINSVDEVSSSPAAINIVKELAKIDYDENNGRYTYSFATKFCNFLNNKFPIYDGYVGGLIYIHEHKNDNFIQKSLANYKFFVNEYKRILDRYGIDSKVYSYKKIDTCMWTFAKIHKLAWGNNIKIDIQYSEEDFFIE